MAVLLVSFLLVAPAFLRRGNPLTIRAYSLYQGDLILTGNNVTVIEGSFDINGSMIVEENATLILRNAILGFTQSRGFQFNITLRSPSDGNPRLLVENTTIATNDYQMYVHLYGNSSMSVDKLTASNLELNTNEFSVVSIGHSEMYRISVGGNSNLNFSNSILRLDLRAYDDSVINVSDCVLGSLHPEGGYIVNVLNSTIVYHVGPRAYSAGFSVQGLRPGFFSYWSFKLNCSVTVAPSGKSSNIILTNTQVNGWIFYLWGFSNATISNSELKDIFIYDFAVVSFFDSFSSKVTGFDNCRVHVYNSTIDELYSYENSEIRLINSAINAYGIYDQSRIHVGWYLYVHVTDSIAQDVSFANVTATYPNATLAERKLTAENGWARLELIERTIKATGNYPAGNYTVEASYESYSKSSIVNITESKEITLSLKDLVVTEFPSFLIIPVLILTTLLSVAVYKRKAFGRVLRTKRINPMFAEIGEPEVMAYLLPQSWHHVGKVFDKV